MPVQVRALCRLLEELRHADYAFVTPTPASHTRVVRRPQNQKARTLRDVFGWSLPFAPDVLSEAVLAALHDADAVTVAANGDLKSSVRVASFDGDLFVHSAFPTDAHDSVFFGPDSYRFARLIQDELVDVRRDARVLDIGTGSGIGAIVAKRSLREATLVATDINPTAITFAEVNAASAGVDLTLVLSADLTAVRDNVDIALANPPYIVDASKRAYRDGGGAHGSEVALRMAAMALERLSPKGRFILYSGSAIIEGGDPFRDALNELARATGITLRYRELDPDVFGEELDNVAYTDVDRIAVVAAIFDRAG